MTTREQFLRDVADHVMEVFQDDGVHRHIRFRKPGTMCMHFDLITWPGYLCYTGDMGTYVFRRLEDMFEFFRLDKSYADKPTPGGVLDRIDRRYWAEKLEATDKSDGHTEFDPKRFKREITVQRRKLLVEHFKDRDQSTRSEFWESFDDVFASAEYGEEATFGAVNDWEFSIYTPQRITRGMDRERIFLSTDDFPDCKTYTHRFLWCCYALRWGIHLYDEPKTK